MRKIVFVNRYYRPDHSATSQLLTDLAEHLAGRGLVVNIVTSRQRYEDAQAVLPSREQIAGVDIHRIWTSRFGRSNLAGRLFDYLSFYLSCSIRLLILLQRDDVLVVKTDPPLLSLIGAIAAFCKRATLVNWLQDLFPEVARELGIRIHPVLYRLLEWARNQTLRMARYNVVLGERMAQRVNAATGAPPKTRIIPNWVLDANIRPVPHHQNPVRSEWALDNKFVIGYSGNLGRAHNYETIIDSARKLQHRRDIVFLFIGSGAGLTAVRDIAVREKLDNIVFKPYQPIDRLAQSLSVPDVHWVSLLPHLEGLIVPSKIYGVLAAGRPLLFVGAHDGEVAKTIDSNGCGLTVSPGDSDSVMGWLLLLADNASMREQLSTRARDGFEREHAYGISVEKWHGLLVSQMDNAR